MATFHINVQDPKQYLHLISGFTHLTPTESEVLGEIISYMQEKRLKVLDDGVRNHIVEKFNYKRTQQYYNLVAVLKKKKVLTNSHNRMEITSRLLPGTTLQINFQEPVTALETFTDSNTTSNGRETGNNQ
jgi:hypothetical protein